MDSEGEMEMELDDIVGPTYLDDDGGDQEVEVVDDDAVDEEGDADADIPETKQVTSYKKRRATLASALVDFGSIFPQIAT
jgi:hypothetical protein